MSRKKPKIVGLEALLAKQPPEHHEGMRQAVKEAFKDFDPANPPGQPVDMLPDGTKQCPHCGVLLEPLTTFQLPGAGKLVQLVECDPCGRSYMLEAKS